MSGADKIRDSKTSTLINTTASFVLAVVLLESIEIVFCKENREIRTLPLMYVVLHSVLVINLIIDWISAVIKSSREKGLSILVVIGVVLLLVIEGYICILAFDSTKTISLLIFITLIACGILYDMYFFGKTSRITYGLFFIARLSFAAMLLVAYFSWRFTGDIRGVLSFVGAYVLVKIVRLYLLARPEVLQLQPQQ